MTHGACIGQICVERPARFGVFASLAVALLLPLGLAACGSDSGQARRSHNSKQEETTLRCRDRVESGSVIVPDPERDAATGRLAFYLARANYRSVVRGRPGAVSSEFKLLALVGSGSPITVTVPPQERTWLKLRYGPAPVAGDRVTFAPCARVDSPAAQRRECGFRPYGACGSRITQFAGGFEIHFARAPQAARCAHLVVRAQKARRQLLWPFVERAQSCSNRGRKGR